MKKIKIFLQIIGIILFSSTLLRPNGNENSYELGAAMYRKLGSPSSVNHWHTGVFNYFEYLPSYSKGYMHYTEAQGTGHETHNPWVSEHIAVSNYASNLSSLKTKLKNAFRHNSYPYYGTYSRIIVPNIRASITSTAREIGAWEIEYTWQDMLIQYGSYWNGAINDIAEIRCDGVVEYSYEKNGVIVANNNNISLAGNSHLDNHNDLHTWGYNWPELCPKIQAGENCNTYSPGSGTSHSLFDPLSSYNPITSDFSTTQYSSKIQINFRVEDNA